MDAEDLIRPPDSFGRFIPYNPYADGPEKTLEHAVGALTVPLVLKDGKYIRPGEQTISFVLSAR